jgi:ATP-dependent RNA helicase RhlE
VDAVGDAFTLIAPEEQKQLTAIERFLGRAVPRVTLPDFDYKRRAPERQPQGNHGGGWGGGRRQGGGGGGGRTHGGGGGGSHRSAPSRGSSARHHAPSTPSAPRPAGGQDASHHGRRPRKSSGMDRRGRRRI